MHALGWPISNLTYSVFMLQPISAARAYNILLLSACDLVGDN